MLARGGGDFAGALRVDGRGVDQQHVGVDVGEQAIVAEVDAFDVRRGGQHGDDQFDIRLGQCGRRACRDGAGLDQGGDGCGGQIEDGQLVAGLEQVARHRRTHVAETEKADMHGGYPSCRGGRPRLVTRAG
ncbi:hypothetical protein D3C78_1495610 [compost metagenome]